MKQVTTTPRTGKGGETSYWRSSVLILGGLITRTELRFWLDYELQKELRHTPCTAPRSVVKPNNLTLQIARNIGDNIRDATKIMISPEGLEKLYESSTTTDTRSVSNNETENAGGAGT